MSRMRKIAILACAALLLAGGAGMAGEHGATTSAADALQQLLDGNQRFIAGRMEHPHQAPARRTAVATGQHPFAAILACSDSRTAPEVLFDRGLGDLFVVRLAGNVADQVVIESLDYSVKHLGVRLVMVLGHTRCGAVTAAVEGHEEPGEVGPMLAELRPAVAAAKGKPGDPVENAVRENVKLIVAKLAASRELGPLVRAGELKVIGGVYDLASGKIELLRD